MKHGLVKHTLFTSIKPYYTFIPLMALIVPFVANAQIINGTNTTATVGQGTLTVDLNSPIIRTSYVVNRNFNCTTINFTNLNTAHFYEFYIDISRRRIAELATPNVAAALTDGNNSRSNNASTYSYLRNFGHLAKGDTIQIRINDIQGTNTVSRTYKIFREAFLPKWFLHYGFALAPKYGSIGKNNRPFYVNQNDDNNLHVYGRNELSSPSIAFMYTRLTERSGRFLQAGPTIGLGYDFKNPSLFMGGSLELIRISISRSDWLPPKVRRFDRNLYICKENHWEHFN
jgi:hypothetical protein